MRMPHITALCALALVAIVARHEVHAQAEPTAVDETAESSRPGEAPEEVVVRGRRLTELRAQVQKTRENAYAIFNEINSTDDFDVHCREESQVFTRVRQRVCRAQFEERISGAAAKEYMATLTWTCPPDARGSFTQECLFSGYGQRAADRARTVEAEAPTLHDRMNDEMQRLAEEDPRFAQAILEFYEASQQYDAARKRREE